ncbi:MAG TPA: RnfABCDGE type electron transport complex subunit D [Spongiibacteraceae bacterium]|nr:RnfABCDGE type electron transport complex subunit D [Spongiibacteraceae bacterium]
MSADTQAAARKFDTAQIMRQVLLALLPGVVATIWFLGSGVVVNILLSVVCCLGCEALAFYLYQQAIAPNLRDGSVLITAVLLGLALPPFAAWWLILLGAIAAVLLAKQAYGGLGQNIFNPAMAGYAVILLLFPAQLAHWSSPAPIASGYTTSGYALDGYTMATALDSFKQNHAFTVADWWRAHAQFGSWGGYGWEWINLAFLGGGLYLLQQKIFSWQIPISVLLALGLLAAIFYDNGSSASGGSPFYHWLSGATMLGAFFIATDPATSATTARSRLCYGALIGALIYVIRSWGHYPDSIAFAMLLGNSAAPLLDKLDTLLRTGSARAKGSDEAQRIEIERQRGETGAQHGE